MLLTFILIKHSPFLLPFDRLPYESCVTTAPTNAAPAASPHHATPLPSQQSPAAGGNPPLVWRRG